ncbi:MAG: DUF4038 domain-containing protein [Ferruginibacter sp.]
MIELFHGARILFLLFFVSAQAKSQYISFPLKASSNKKYLMGQDDKPVFLKGCAAWRLGYNVTYDEAKKFLADRKSKNFNALIIEISPDNGANNRGNAPNVYGEYCFVNKDISKPNEKFFAHCDSILQLCSDMNFAVVLFPLYLGCCNDGWLEILREAPNTPGKCGEYGKWVASRYRHLPNITWASGGDHNETPESIAFAEGIASVDTIHLHTYHTNPAYTSTERLPDAKWLTLSCIYTYFPEMNVGEYHVYGQIYNEKLRNDRIPFIMSESAYEYERNETTQTLRRQAYWALLSGASGHFFGNRDIWMMNKNWRQALNTPGNKSMQVFHSLIQHIPWYNMDPDWQHLVFISGRGAFNAGTAPGGEEYATGAFAKDNSVAVLYLPGYRKVGVNLERFKNQITIKWLDPSNGNYIALKKKFNNKSVEYFTPPFLKNSQGFEDWVLIVETIK